jgi:signal transduction histidine kinase/ligand-binding sensor domain-containing protein
MSRRLLLVVALLLGVTTAAVSQEGSNLLSEYSLTSWTDGDGIRLGTVNAIAQDGDGYLWIATSAGLLRFDGARFTTWNNLAETALPPAPASALLVARDGTLWVGLAEGGARHLRGSQLLPQDQPRGALTSVTDLAEDHRGAIWAVSDNALFKVEHDRWRPVSLSLNGRRMTVQRLFVSRDGAVWAATATGGIFKWDDAHGEFHQITAGFAWDVHEDDAGRMWRTDVVAGFRRLEQARAGRRPFSGSGYRLTHDRRGNLWIATLGEGLWRAQFDARGSETVERTMLRTGLSSDSVQSLFEDRDGNIWIGTTAGLHRLTQRKLAPVQDVGFVTDVAASDNGVEVGTTNGMLALSAPAGGLPRIEGASRGPALRTLFRDARGTWWLGTNNGAWSLSKGAYRRVPIAPAPATAVTAVTSAAGHGIWFGYNAWLYRWDGTTASPLDTAPSQHVEQITQAFADSTGRVWIAFGNGRIGVIETTGTFRVADDREGLANATQPFLEDDSHGLWSFGSSGISLITNRGCATIDKASGLPPGRVWSAVEDDQGYFWLSMDRGLVRIRRDELLAATADRSQRVQYKLYGTADGLAGAPLGNVRSVRAADGRLWFVMGGGLTEVDPKQIAPIQKPSNAPVRIETAVANEERLTPLPMMSLPPGTKRLQISYTAVALSPGNEVSFRYRLDGFDTDWAVAGARRQAFYTNLLPGKYQFHVEANGEDGSWTPSSATWQFVIEPAFYQTMWFYGASSAGLALMVAIAWRLRLRRIRREFTLVLAERARLSREIHDTLLQSLVGVALQFDGIATTLDASSAALAQLVKIRRHVEAYIREARQSIWDLRSPVLEAHDLFAALREFGKDAAAPVNARFSATTVGTPRDCPPKVENQLLRIGQEALTNAVRHSGASRISLELRFDRDAVTLRVSDDGRGFEYREDGHEIDDHYGLTSMRERAQELGGRLSVFTGAGKGTIIEAIVPDP